MKLNSTQPQVRTYVDARTYLQDVYDWRKSTSRGFSYTSWAGEMGFKSRSFLRLILVGKRSITENSIPAFIKGLKLKKDDAEYFSALVRFTQAATLANREFYQKELERLGRKSEQLTEVHDRYQFLASYLGPRLQVLLTLEGLDRSEESLARLLGVRVASVSSMLETLGRIGMARQNGTQWEATSPTFEVKSKLGDVALQSFHRRSLEEAITAIDMPPSVRAFQSVVLSLGPESYQEVNQELRSFLIYLLEKYRSSSEEHKRLYQMNVNLIPVTGPILRYGVKPPGASAKLASVHTMKEKKNEDR